MMNLKYWAYDKKSSVYDYHQYAHNGMCFPLWRIW